MNDKRRNIVNNYQSREGKILRKRTYRQKTVEIRQRRGSGRRKGEGGGVRGHGGDKDVRIDQ